MYPWCGRTFPCTRVGTANNVKDPTLLSPPRETKWYMWSIYHTLVIPSPRISADSVQEEQASACNVGSYTKWYHSQVCLFVPRNATHSFDLVPVSWRSLTTVSRANCPQCFPVGHSPVLNVTLAQKGSSL